MYTLCLVIVYMLTGEGIQKAAERRTLDTLPQILKGLSLTGRMQNTLLKGLSLDKNQRYASVKAFSDDFLGKTSEESTFSNGVSVYYHARTDIGKRDINQDNCIIDTVFTYAGEDCEIKGTIDCGQSEYHVVAVADGVASVNYGELASKAAIQAVSHFIDQNKDNAGLAEKLLEELLLQINEKILTLSKKTGMTATTLSILLWKNDEYCAASIGNCPIYLLRGRKLFHLSQEHTAAREKIEQNRQITPQIFTDLQGI